MNPSYLLREVGFGWVTGGGAQKTPNDVHSGTPDSERLMLRGSDHLVLWLLIVSACCYAKDPVEMNE